MRQRNNSRQIPGARVIGPAATALVAIVLVGAIIYQQQQTIQSLNARISALELQAADLQARWYGTPALWQPPTNAGVEFRYFDVNGKTQLQLIDSLDHSDICTKYGPCQPDPAVPKGVAWGLAGFEATTSSLACYSPSTTTVEFRYFVVMPRWSPAADGTVQIPLVKRWNALEQSIYTHEAGHIDIDRKDLADLNSRAQQLGSCDAVGQFWADSHVFDQLNADQNAYHARLRADCRPEVGCIPPGWMGW